MAITIGNVQFNIDANTRGMQKALSSLNAFEKKINAVARAQTSGAKAMVSAMTKQESLLKRNALAAVKMQDALKKGGAAPAQIAAVSNAFGTLTRQLTKGALTTREYTRAVDSFNLKMQKSGMIVKNFKTADAAAKANRFTETLRNLESASVLAVGPLSGIGARIRSLGAIFSRSQLLMAAFFGGMAAGLVVVAKLTTAAVRAGVAWEQSMARFQAATGDVKLAAKQMLFVIDTSKTLGLRINESAKSFSRLTAAASGTKLAGKGVRDVFAGVTKAAAALRLSNVEVEGTFRAIEQMISKGTVQAEELRGQLGERLPGAFRLAAKAMGVTTQELGNLLKQGQVLSDDFLPKFARVLEEAFGEAAKANLESFGGSVNTLANSWFIFSKQFDETTRASKIAAAGLRKLSGILDGMTDGMGTMAKVFGLATGALIGFGTSMLIISSGAVLAGMVKFVKTIALAARAVAGFNVAIAAFPAAKLITALLKISAVVAGAAIGWKAMERVMADADDVITKLGETAEGAVQPLLDLLNVPSADVAGFVKELDRLEQRLGAISEGTQELELFDRLSRPINAFKDALDKSNLTVTESIELQARFGVLIRQTIQAEDRLTDVAQRSADAVSNGLEDIIFKASSAKDAIKDLISELIKLAFRAAIFDPISSKLGKVFSTFNILGTAATGGVNVSTVTGGNSKFVSGANIFSGRAAGGPVRAGTSFPIGEDGPELFTPSVNGNITPNNQLGRSGGGGNINININAPGADAGTIARIREMIIVDMVPGIIQQSTRNTITQLNRPSFA